MYQDIAEYVNDNEFRQKINCNETSEKNRSRFKRQTAIQRQILIGLIKKKIGKIALTLIKTYKQKTNSKTLFKSIMLKTLINPNFIFKILQT